MNQTFNNVVNLPNADELCFCGSGEKYKNCCMHYAQDAFNSLNFLALDKPESHISPEEQIQIALEISVQNYMILKYGTICTVAERQAFVDETVFDIKKVGDYERLIEKTIEMHNAFDSKWDELTSHKLDDFVNEWLELLILPKNYGYEENALRFKSVSNWYWSSFFMEIGISDVYHMKKR